MHFENVINKALLQPIELSDLMRVGGQHDGGYVVPARALRASKVLLSFGLSSDWTFERHVRELHPAMPVRAYDHTVGPRKFRKDARKALLELPVNCLALSPRRVKRSWRKFSNSANYFRFFRGNVQHIRKRVWYNNDQGSAAIDQIIADAGQQGPCSILAKIDIEGSEYRILPCIIERAGSFCALIVEFHDTDICAAVFNDQVSRLLGTFYIAHVHGNNFRHLSIEHAMPTALEITLINKQLVPEPAEKFKGQLPRPGLDAPNNPEREEYAISFE